MDYRKLNKATRKDHFPLPFIDEMLERLANHSFFSYLDGYSGYHQIPIHPDQQSKNTFTCPYGTCAWGVYVEVVGRQGCDGGGRRPWARPASPSG